MKQRMVCLVVGALALGAASVASAQVGVSINLGVPPVVYQPDPYYVAPPAVYIGGGNWGGDHHWRGHHDHRHR